MIKYLRSLNPLNNTSVIKSSQGQSSSFFITTDDNNYIIKTLKPDEFNYIFLKFLVYYYLHIQDHNDSLICRLYGIYSVKVDTGDPLVIILMRNGRGSLSNVFFLLILIDYKIYLWSKRFSISKTH